jgi:hypothetical protein
MLRNRRKKVTRPNFTYTTKNVIPRTPPSGVYLPYFFFTGLYCMRNNNTTLVSSWYGVGGNGDNH